MAQTNTSFSAWWQPNRNYHWGASTWDSLWGTGSWLGKVTDPSFFSGVPLSAWRQVGCFLLHIVQVNLFQQSLDVWPFFKQPKQSLFSLTNMIPFWSTSVWDFKQASKWWSVFLQNAHFDCGVRFPFGTLELSCVVLAEKLVLFSLIS